MLSSVISVSQSFINVFALYKLIYMLKDKTICLKTNIKKRSFAAFIYIQKFYL